MLDRIVSAAALIAATFAPAAALAQEARTSSVPIYNFVQLSVNAATIAPGDFKARTEEIRSCGDARKLAKTIGARANNSHSVMATLLPYDLRPILASTQTGRATPVLVEKGSALHVVVICHRS